MGTLDGRIAVVTGGTRGIGRGIAEGLLAAGAKVVVNGRSEEKGKRAIEEMSAGDNAHFIAADVCTREGAEALVDGTVAHFGGLHIMVNNTGGGDDYAPVAELTDESMELGLVLNVWSTFWCSRRALATFVPQKWGRIINVSSIEGKIAKPAIAPYVVGKHGVNGLTKSMAVEYALMGITSNALCPGGIETDLMKDKGPGAAEAMGISYQDLLDSFADGSLIKRLNTVEEVAAMAVVLASDAGGGITGQCINIDGGSVMSG